jgi:hypothetical protein
MWELTNCKSCGSRPTKNKYESDGSFYHTSTASIFCQCGVSVSVETYNDRDLDKGNGHDIEKSQFSRAMMSAEIKWNSLNR